MSSLQDPTEPPSADPAPATTGGGGGGARTIVVGVLATVVVLGIALALSGGGDDGVVPQPLPGDDGATEQPGAAAGFGLTDAVDVLPDFTLETFGADGEVDVASYLGGAPLVVNFWATWCAPCVAEMPDFQDLHEAAGDTLRLVGINTQDAALNAEPFAAELGITYDLAADRQGEYFARTGGFGMPTTLFVQPDGTVSFRQTGPLTPEQMRDLVREHLGVDVPATPA